MVCLVSTGKYSVKPMVSYFRKRRYPAQEPGEMPSSPSEDPRKDRASHRTPYWRPGLGRLSRSAASSGTTSSSSGTTSTTSSRPTCVTLPQLPRNSGAEVTLQNSPSPSCRLPQETCPSPLSVVVRAENTEVKKPTWVLEESRLKQPYFYRIHNFVSYIVQYNATVVK